ncbi:MAG: peptidase T [Burkholderiaceae bacterium]|nr:peptidase T [Burkholderiaceae bacterium]
MSKVLERFLNYVAFDTQSERDSEETPSSAKQLRLAEFLVEELQGMGIANAHIGDGGVVYATLDATPGYEKCPGMALLAHMDTSPDASGADIKPQIIHYEGGDVVLNAEKNIVLTLDHTPELAKYAGQDVVFTDGTTLLGADDKAGIAEIVDMAAYLLEHPEVPHAKIVLCFTPDEEVARGTDNVNVEKLGCQYGYTFDGDETGVLEYENFNAATAHVTIHGVGVHPGLAKDKMVNSARIAAKFMERLPMEQSPECTDGHEGFMHPNHMECNVVKSYIRILVRDHDMAKFEEMKAYLKRLGDEFNATYGEGTCEVVIKDSYYNMLEKVKLVPKVLDVVRNAYHDCGLTPNEKPIRGGTDGAALTEMGLPCPNVFTGGFNFHGVYEFLPVPSLEKARDVAIALAKRSAEIDSLS